MSGIGKLAELFGIDNSKQETQEIKTPALDRSKRCQAVQLVGVCGNPITDGGVEHSGFCEECWTVDIVTAHELYREYRADGVSRNEAIEKAMINTKDGVGSYAVKIKHVRVKQAVTDFDKDKHIYEGIGKTDPNFSKEDL